MSFPVSPKNMTALAASPPSVSATRADLSSTGSKEMLSPRRAVGKLTISLKYRTVEPWSISGPPTSAIRKSSSALMSILPSPARYMSRARTKGKRAHPERGVPDEPGWPYRVVLLRARSKPRLLNVRLHPARMGEANGPDDRPTDDAAVREVATGSDAPARASPWSVSSVMRSGGGVADFASRVSPSDRTSRANLRDPTNTAPPRGGQGRPADAKSVAAEPSVNGTRRRRSQLVSASLVTADGRAIGW